MNRRPILVTGSHRSGSSWVGETIALSPEVGYIHEPFNVGHDRNIYPVEVPYWFLHIDQLNEQEYRPALERTLAFRYSMMGEFHSVGRINNPRQYLVDSRNFRRCRLKHCRPLMKDPNAFFSAEWLARTFDMDVIVLTRHPAAFCASLIRLGMRHPFGDFLAQPRLLDEYLEPFRAQIERMATDARPTLDQGILLWRMIAHSTRDLQNRHPDWMFLRYEDLAGQPIPSFRHIYSRLGLHMSAGTKKTIERDLQPNLHGWKELLSDAQVRQVRTETSDFASYFYSADDW